MSIAAQPIAPPRDQWTSWADFIMSCIGMTSIFSRLLN